MNLVWQLHDPQCSMSMQWESPWFFSGLVVDYPTEIDAGEETTALYEKRSNSATGSAFMLTYDVIRKTTDKPYAKVRSKSNSS